MRNKIQIVVPVLLIGSFAFLYRGITAGLVRDWAADPNYSHGFLIVPLALFFAWERRQELASAESRGSLLGLPLILGSLTILIAGVLGSEFFLTRVSMLGVAAGILLFVWGRQHLQILAFPVLFLLLMIPLPALIFNQIAFPLQMLASRFGEVALILCRVPVVRAGNVIHLTHASLEVAEACSGIRSLISLLTLGIVYGYFFEPRAWGRTALALSALPIAIAANGLRVAGTGMAAQYWGAEAAQGFFHAFSGWLIFLAALIMLFAVHRALLRVQPRKTG